MESLTPSVQTIEDVNEKLDRLLASLHPAPASFSLTTEQMTAILAEVVRVGEWLGTGLAHEAEPRLAKQLARYRGHLELLRQLLPGIHAQALAERSRIQTAQNHLEAAAAWAQSAGKQAS